MTPHEASTYIKDQMETSLEEDMQDFARRIAKAHGFPDGKARETSPGVWTIYLIKPVEYVTVNYTIDNKTPEPEES